MDIDLPNHHRSEDFRQWLFRYSQICSSSYGTDHSLLCSWHTILDSLNSSGAKNSSKYSHEGVGLTLVSSLWNFPTFDCIFPSLSLIALPVRQRIFHFHPATNVHNLTTQTACIAAFQREPGTPCTSHDGEQRYPGYKAAQQNATMQATFEKCTQILEVKMLTLLFPLIL